MKSFRVYTKEDPEYKKVRADDKMSKWLLDNYLIPNYTEVSVFLIFLVLLMTGYEFWNLNLSSVASKEFMSYLKEDADMYLVLLGVVVCGGAYSTYYAFNFKKVPPKEHAKVMVAFAVIIEFIAAFILLFSFSVTGVIGITLAGLNLLHALAMLIALDVDKSAERGLKPVQGKPIDLLLGAILVITVFLVLRYYFEMNLAVVFSGCLSYALIFNQLISQVFVKR